MSRQAGRLYAARRHGLRLVDVDSHCVVLMLVKHPNYTLECCCSRMHHRGARKRCGRTASNCHLLLPSVKQNHQFEDFLEGLKLFDFDEGGPQPRSMP